MKKLIASISAAVIAALFVPAAALAHVVVTPSQAAVGNGVLFSVSVPSERQSDVTSIRLTVPAGLSDVEPTVLAGWNIVADGGTDVRSITWTGDIPAGQRADFTFKATAPARAGALDWKAYQTYADGTVVHWDQKPAARKTDDDAATSGPYSITHVTDDLTAEDNSAAHSNRATLTLALSLAALAFGTLAFLQKRRK